MSDIEDWENFNEASEIQRNKKAKKNIFFDESEEILKPRYEPRAPKPEFKEKQDDQGNKIYKKIGGQGLGRFVSKKKGMEKGRNTLNRQSLRFLCE